MFGSVRKKSVDRHGVPPVSLLEKSQVTAGEKVRGSAAL